ncbi:hypothetical protein D9619_008480 [Psilocybe cf. subviscida]|uniref:Uncharacterized protein n=1 Tax=Psilocybe cf. subviscida TaxID=2480587 RepID=A0A8H5BAE6_9AGAR|nr:hypothetical protein D9619_008480 [Psilocybe cf. subviscida]
MHSLPIEGEKMPLLLFSICLYGRSTILATALFALHCIQIAGSFILSHYVSGLLNFNPICNGRDVPRIVLSALFPVVMISIGGCRYILRFERDRDTRAKLMEAARSTEGKGEQFVGEGQLQGSVLPTQTGYRHSYPPPRQAETHLPRSSLEAFSMRTSESPAGGHSIDMVASNYPYLHGAESYILNRNRSSATTFTNSSIGTNHSPQGSSDCRSRHTASTPLSHAQGSEGRAGSGSVLRAENADSADGEDQNDEAEETQSESNIELGSLQSSSSLNSEELRRFYNGT